MKNLHGHPVEMERSFYKLKCDRHALDFINLLDDFRLKELYCDATIACDGKKYPIHQVVLSACSDFFADIFASVNCQNPLVVIQDVSCWELEAILTYAYRGEVKVPLCHLQRVLRAARSLNIKGLMFPCSEKRDSESAIGTWSEPYENRIDDPHSKVNGRMDHQRPFPPATRIQQSEEFLNSQLEHNPSNYSLLPVNSARLNDHLRRENIEEEEPLYSYGRDLEHHKRIHYLGNYPQDLRITNELAVERYSPRSNSNEYSSRDHDRWEDEASVQSRDSTGDLAKDSTVSERTRIKSDTVERQEESISTPSKFKMSKPHRTFQELVAGDEAIKQEPDDIDSDSKDGVKDKQIESDEDDEEYPLQIDMMEDPVSDSRCNSAPDPKEEAKSYMQLPEPYSRTTDTSTCSQEPNCPTSQLRKELLRPVTQTSPGHVQPQPPRAGPLRFIPSSIPHPVIATRELQPKPQLSLREPPPLMKITQNIPTLIEECENHRERPSSIVKEIQVGRGNNHLLVTAPPSYHSHNFNFEIHNQHLGPVFVNSVSPIQLSPASAFSVPKRQHSDDIKNHNNLKIKSNDFGYDNERPLNLSGVQKSPSYCPKFPGSEDPFLGKIVTNRKKRLRGPKSWEFLVRLLMDPTTNPNLIRWENESNGIFRLVQPAIIAQRWGRRTGKHASENLSYENFARGLRYHYATGALKPVSEKSFVYRFGPKALRLLQEGDNVAFTPSKL